MSVDMTLEWITFYRKQNVTTIKFVYGYLVLQINFGLMCIHKYSIS